MYVRLVQLERRPRQRSAGVLACEFWRRLAAIPLEAVS